MERFRADHPANPGVATVKGRFAIPGVTKVRCSRCFPMQRRQSPFALLLVAVFTLLLTSPVHASFIDAYAFSNFTTTNFQADGGAVTWDGGLSVIITGGNLGDGSEGTTDWLMQSVATGTVSFDFYYASLDFPGMDYAGYLVDGNFEPLGNVDGTTGSGSFDVVLGDLFGFRVGTLDNTGEPGVLTVSNFSGPEPSGPGGGDPPVPEPGTGPILLTAIVTAAFYLRVRRARGCKEHKS